MVSHRRDALIGIGCLAGALFLVAPALGLSPPLAYLNKSPSVPLGGGSTRPNGRPSAAMSWR